jgi:glycosyltransferase involved in cell wall biosynthesis
MVSIVMPAWNEAEIIEACVREWQCEVIAKLPGSELIIVDDCSTDSTGGILRRLEEQFGGVRRLSPERNGGHGKALRLGFDHATQPFVFQTDSDRQHLPSEFWKLWELREQADLVLGIRSGRADGATRIVITNCMRVLNLAVWGVWVADANCPFKLMRREALSRVLERVPRDCFIPMVLVSILSRKKRFRIREVIVTHLPRKGGSQSLKGIVKWTKVGLRCAWQVFSIRMNYSGR